MVLLKWSFLGSNSLTPFNLNTLKNTCILGEYPQQNTVFVQWRNQKMLSWSRKGITKSDTCPRANLTTAKLSLHLPILTTYVNVLSVILVSYHFILLLHRGSTVLPGRKGTGPDIPEPGLDPRPPTLAP